MLMLQAASAHLQTCLTTRVACVRAPFLSHVETNMLQVGSIMINLGTVGLGFGIRPSAMSCWLQACLGLSSPARQALARMACQPLLHTMAAHHHAEHHEAGP